MDIRDLSSAELELVAGGGVIWGDDEVAELAAAPSASAGDSAVWGD